MPRKAKILDNPKEFVECQLCKKQCKGKEGLSLHVVKLHSCEITKEEYYLKYINSTSITLCKTCNKKTKFRDMVKGYPTHCSLSCMNKDPEFQEKSRQGVMDKYGVENVFQSKEIQAKVKSGLLNKYGVTHNSYIKETLELRQQTFKENHNTPELIDGVKNKRKETCLKRFNAEHCLSAPEVREKITATNIEKYGVC